LSLDEPFGESSALWVNEKILPEGGFTGGCLLFWSRDGAGVVVLVIMVAF
jgi:hypothetical protein